MKRICLKLKEIRKLILVLVVIMLPSLTINAQADLQEGLIANYPFDGNANDESGNSHNGVVYGAELTIDRFGNGNSAYKFDGDDYISAKGASVFNVNEEGYSILLWVYIEDYQANSYPRLMGYGGNNNDGWDIELGGNHVLFNFNNSSLEQHCFQGIRADFKQWFQYAVIYANDTIKAFIDGEFIVEKYCPTYHPASGFDLVIGASSNGLNNEFVGKIDDVRIYNRALSDVEIALLSGNNSALIVAQKGTDFYADFEDGTLKSYNKDYGIADENRGVIRVVRNPEKDNVNSSDYVMLAITKESEDVRFSRAEYYTDWGDPFKTKNRKHIFQWMAYFPVNYLANVEINGNWLLLSQFVTHPCANGEADFDDPICGSGGIFNEVRINRANYDEFGFEYRARPDCNTILYDYPKGKWIKFTYEIFWTTELNGYYKVWADEELLGEAKNVRTLPEGFIEGDCDIRWKVGLYDSWTSDVVDSVYYYIDNLEVYIDKDIDELYFNSSDKIKLHPNPVSNKVQVTGLTGLVEIAIYDVKGNLIKTFVALGEFSVSDLKQGLYFVKIKQGNIEVAKKMIKQ